jgi:glucose-6-phosphate dehydrogenase assembly protein OpcA
VNVTLESAERALARLWSDETKKTGAPRIGLMTIVALVSEPSLLDRARDVVGELVRTYPSRTIVAVYHDAAESEITANVSLHRAESAGPACGDAIVLEAAGGGREWLPDNIERLALVDLPICLWWVGDVPDVDHLFDRLVGGADLVIVNSGEMDLRDLEKLSQIVDLSHERFALSDLAWFRLRPIQDLVARFFDGDAGAGLLQGLSRVTVEFTPLDRNAPGAPVDVTSTEAGLLFGWMAHVLGLPVSAPQWSRGEAAADVVLGAFRASFVRRVREDIRPGSVLRVVLESPGGRFAIERQEDPCVLVWSREVSGGPVTTQTVRVRTDDEAKLLVRCLERSSRDPLLEASLRAGSRIAHPVAPRLSERP